MTATVSPRRDWLLPAGILIAMALYLWSDPIAVVRTRQMEQAVKDDPYSGAGLAATAEPTGPILARQIDPIALSALRKQAALGITGAATCSMLVDAEGRVSDVRVIGGSLTPDSAIAVVKALEGQRLFQAAQGAPTVRTVAGPLSLRQPART